MSDETFGCGVLIAFLVAACLFGKCAVDDNREWEKKAAEEKAQQHRDCTNALRGVTPSESVRVYRIQPKCLEARP